MEQLMGNLHRHMEYLCLEIGSKHCGSPELDKAGQYIGRVLQDNGCEVTKEYLPVRGWDFRSFELMDVTSGKTIPASCACYFSNAVDITDVPLWIDEDGLQNLENLSVQGRLCFLAVWRPGNGLVAGYNSIAEQLDRMGAAAAIFLNRVHSQLAPSTKIQRSPFLKQLGTAAVAHEGAIYMANHRDHTYRLRIDASCFDAESYNVIGRIGHGPKKGVIGAHYDTAPLIQGANDDIAGTVTMTELTRILRPELEKLADDWTFDFVAFTGEEYIAYDMPMGSGAYIERHKEEDIRWFVNIDDHTPYFSISEVVVTNPDKLPKVKYPYANRTVTGYTHCDGDDRAFCKYEIPTIWISADKLYRELHTAMDDIDHVDFDRMALGVREYADIVRQLL